MKRGQTRHTRHVVNVMTLPNMAPNLKAHRLHLFKMLHKHKKQLAYAYASRSDYRITRAKHTLIRTLLELHGSPELGPQVRFNWGWQLELLIQFGVDNEISWERAQSATSWFAAADLLAASIQIPESSPEVQILDLLPV